MEQTEYAATLGDIERAARIVAGVESIVGALEAHAEVNETPPEALAIVGRELHVAAQLMEKARSGLMGR